VQEGVVSRGARNDVVVVGGGVVGAACALALAGLDLEVTLVEAAEPPRCNRCWSAGRWASAAMCRSCAGSRCDEPAWS